MFVKSPCGCKTCIVLRIASVKTQHKASKNLAKTRQNARFLYAFTHSRARQCTVQKIGRGGNERGGEEDEEDEGSLSKISSEETLSKLKLNQQARQSPRQSTKHAGRPADLWRVSKIYVCFHVFSLFMYLIYLFIYLFIYLYSDVFRMHDISLQLYLAWYVSNICIRQPLNSVEAFTPPGPGAFAFDVNLISTELFVRLYCVSAPFHQSAVCPPVVPWVFSS